MTDNLQLKTSRLTDASSGKLINESLADIENCLSVIFGATKDSPIAPCMDITGPDVEMLGTLTLASAPTNALHAATKKYVDDNAGSGSIYICKAYRSASQNIAASSNDEIPFTTAYIEEGSSDQWDVASPTRVVCKSAGDYLIVGDCYWDPYDYTTYLRTTPYEILFSLLLNGVEIIGPMVQQYNDNSVVYSTNRTFGLMRSLSENDYLELRAYNLQTAWGEGGGTLSIIKVA